MGKKKKMGVEKSQRANVKRKLGNIKVMKSESTKH